MRNQVFIFWWCEKKNFEKDIAELNAIIADDERLTKAFEEMARKNETLYTDVSVRLQVVLLIRCIIGGFCHHSLQRSVSKLSQQHWIVRLITTY